MVYEKDERREPDRGSDVLLGDTHDLHLRRLPRWKLSLYMASALCSHCSGCEFCRRKGADRSTETFGRALSCDFSGYRADGADDLFLLPGFQLPDVSASDRDHVGGSDAADWSPDFSA